MALTTAGINFIAGAITGQGTMFDNSNAYIGVGNGTAAFAASQNDLTGDSKLRKPMEPGYPIVEAPSVTFRATFNKEEANFPWNEWGIFNASTGGVMLNRTIESNGTKQSNQTWVLDVEVTFTI